MTYLTETQINEMADAALARYEMTADSAAARLAAREYALDEFGIKHRASAVMLAWKRAHTAWLGEKMRVRRIIENAS